MKKYLLLPAILFLFTAPAHAFFGDPCLISPYTYIECYGVNPGIFRTDLGNEILSITKEVWKVNSMLSMLKAPDLSFPEIPAGQYDRTVKPPKTAASHEIAADRTKAVEYNQYVSSETGEKRSDLANSLYGAGFTPAMSGQMSARTAEMFKTAEMAKNGMIAGGARQLFEKVPEIMTKDRTDIPDLSKGLLSVLESLGLGAQDLAIVRDIAVNLSKLHEEEIRTAELRIALAEMRVQKNVLLARTAQMAGAQYAETIRLNLGHLAPQR